MSFVPYEVNPLPEAVMADPQAVLAKYEALLHYDIPALVVRDAELDAIDHLIVSSDLARRSNAFDNPVGNHETYLNPDDVDYAVSDYHVDRLPVRGLTAVMHHHKATVCPHVLTVASFAPTFLATPPASNVAGGTLSEIGKLSTSLDAALRADVRDPNVVRPDIYRGRVETGDVVVIRIAGENPTVHDFRTIPILGKKRGAIIRGYTAIRLSV